MHLKNPMFSVLFSLSLIGCLEPASKTSDQTMGGNDQSFGQPGGGNPFGDADTDADSDSDADTDSDTDSDTDTDTDPVDNDQDNDGFDNEAAGGDDCNDGSASVHPGAFDVPGNGVDEDCDGGDALPDLDADNDGFDDEDLGGDDCDDTDPSVHPGASEIAGNGIDDDCAGGDGVVDLDGDNDGFDVGADCNDADHDIHPGATDIPGNGVDEDCSGTDALLDLDVDNDGFDAVAHGGDDCNDSSASVHPGALDIPGNGVDEDCQGGDAVVVVDDTIEVCVEFDAGVTSAEIWAANVTTWDYSDWFTGTPLFDLTGIIAGHSYCAVVPNAVVGDDVLINGTTVGGNSYFVYGDTVGEVDGSATSNGVDCHVQAHSPADGGGDYLCDGSGGGAVDHDLDNDGHDATSFGGDDCDDSLASIHPGATELCDGVDQNCELDIDDEIDQCWDSVYRFKSPTSETRCWNVDSTSVPSYCTGYGYEREAFIIAQQQFDGNVPLYSCVDGEDQAYWFDQILTLDFGDMTQLETGGYTCDQVGYAWTDGHGPTFNPFNDLCEARRYVWDASALVGNGHVFTIFDDTTDLILESDVFNVVTDQVCF